MPDRRRRTRPALRQRRRRYHGFTLAGTDQDRIVASFIDSYEGDLAELIKSYLYQQATGTVDDWTTIRQALEALRRQVEELAARSIPTQEYTPRVESNATTQALKRFQT